LRLNRLALSLDNTPHDLNVVRASIDKEALAKAMRLSDHHKIILAQSVGYAKE